METFELGDKVLGIGTDHLYTGEIVGHVRPQKGVDVFYVLIDQGQYNGGSVRQFSPLALRPITVEVAKIVSEFREKENETKSAFETSLKNLGIDVEAEKKKAGAAAKALGDVVNLLGAKVSGQGDPMYQ